jgi:6,7-dimethyl-8-ribityllumazine synthase
MVALFYFCNMATTNKNLSSFDPKTVPSGSGKKIGLVISEWNAEITEGLKEGAIHALEKCGTSVKDILIEYVPGTFELSLGAQFLLESTDVDAVIAIGCVVRGETAHFDYVCQGATQGIQNVSLRFNQPVMFCVLTDDTIQQSRDRSGGKYGNKGIEAAVGALKMLSLKDRLK